jgi:hypothetical protein
MSGAKHMKRLGWLVGMFALGCGGGSSSSSAAMGGSCRVNAADTCEDYDAASSASARQACSASGTWSDSSCGRSGAAGGCRESTSGVSTTVWYYQGSADSVRQGCMLAGGTFVDGDGSSSSDGGGGGGGNDLGLESPRDMTQAITHFDPTIQADIDNLGCSAASCHGGTTAPLLVQRPVAATDKQDNYDDFKAEAMMGAASKVLVENLSGSSVTHAGGSAFASKTDPIYQRWLLWIDQGNPR